MRVARALASARSRQLDLPQQTPGQQPVPGAAAARAPAQLQLHRLLITAPGASRRRPRGRTRRRSARPQTSGAPGRPPGARLTGLRSRPGGPACIRRMAARLVKDGGSQEAAGSMHEPAPGAGGRHTCPAPGTLRPARQRPGRAAPAPGVPTDLMRPASCPHIPASAPAEVCAATACQAVRPAGWPRFAAAPLLRLLLLLGGAARCTATCIESSGAIRPKGQSVARAVVTPACSRARGAGGRAAGPQGPGCLPGRLPTEPHVARPAAPRGRLGFVPRLPAPGAAGPPAPACARRRPGPGRPVLPPA
jgi:hypothetical protein